MKSPNRLLEILSFSPLENGNSLVLRKFVMEQPFSRHQNSVVQVGPKLVRQHQYYWNSIGCLRPSIRRVRSLFGTACKGFCSIKYDRYKLLI